MPTRAWAGIPPGSPKPGASLPTATRPAHRRADGNDGTKATRTIQPRQPTECPHGLDALFRLGASRPGHFLAHAGQPVLGRPGRGYQRDTNERTEQPTECPRRPGRVFRLARPGPGISNFLLLLAAPHTRGPGRPLEARRMPPWLGWILRLICPSRGVRLRRGRRPGARVPGAMGGLLAGASQFGRDWGSPGLRLELAAAHGRF